MSEGFLRTEVWHPLSVHFPIALLLFSTLSLLISLFIKSGNAHLWHAAGTGLLYVGTALAWLAVYTGNQADGIVARKICDPTILKDHEMAGQATTYLFTAAALLSVLSFSKYRKVFMSKIASILIVVLSVAGSVGLVYTGHLGARLVYEEGAGVNGHNVECDE